MEIPKVDKLQNITPEQAAEYVRFVATLRHNQKRWFKFKDTSALNLSRQMEKELDKLNGRLLNHVPSLFDQTPGDMECNKCEFSELCGLYSKDSQCIHPNLRERIKQQPLV